MLKKLSILCLFLLVSACGKGPDKDASLALEEAYIHYELGMDYYGIKEVDKAMTEWREAIKLNPDSEARHMLGQAYYSKGDIEAARKEWEGILARDPNNFMALNNLGSLFKEQGQGAKALDYYSRALAANPKLATAHLNMGIIYSGQGDSGRAKAELTRALELDPHMGVAMFEMGKLLVKEGKTDKALTYFQKLADGQARKDEGFDPKLAGYASLGKLYLSAGKFKESEKNLKKGLEIQPSNPALHCTLANLYEVRGHNGKAVKEYQLAIKLDPKFAYAYGGLGNLYVRMGGKRLKEAEAMTLKGMDLDPGLKDHLLDTLGWIYFRQGRLDKALARVEEALQLTGPEAKESLSTKHYHLGMIYRAKGERAKARENFQQARDLFPGGESAKKAAREMGA